MCLIQTTKRVTNIRYDFVKLLFIYSLAVTSHLNNQLRLRAQSGSCAARGPNPESLEESAILVGIIVVARQLILLFCFIDCLNSKGTFRFD